MVVSMWKGDIAATMNGDLPLWIKSNVYFRVILLLIIMCCVVCGLRDKATVKWWSGHIHRGQMGTLASSEYDAKMFSLYLLKFIKQFISALILFDLFKMWVMINLSAKYCERAEFCRDKKSSDGTSACRQDINTNTESTGAVNTTQCRGFDQTSSPTGSSLVSYEWHEVHHDVELGQTANYNIHINDPSLTFNLLHHSHWSAQWGVNVFDQLAAAINIA